MRSLSAFTAAFSAAAAAAVDEGARDEIDASTAAASDRLAKPPELRSSCAATDSVSLSSIRTAATADWGAARTEE